jgi:CHASE2 domain-containing sensor protein
MSKLVILKIISGDWKSGFPVVLQIGEENQLSNIEQFGYLPGQSQLMENYQQWQSIYRRLSNRLRLEAPPAQETNVSKPEKCQQAVTILKNSLNQWLDSESFRPLQQLLFQNLRPSEQIRFIIQTDNFELQQLPWHLWKFFDDYDAAEIILKSPNRRFIEKPEKNKRPVRILAILGDSDKIDIEADRQFLENLPDKPDVCFLPEPRRSDISDRLWSQEWDILFFAGHSRTEGQTGKIYINKEDSLTIEELKHGLNNAIKGGLQLAIFNSCDGLGIARDLADLQIPQIMVMREPVPDEVAQQFLKNFLRAFVYNKSPIHLALRNAREQLQGLEKDYPCASWLPVIYQNLSTVPTTWQQLRDGISPRKSTAIFQHFAYPIVIAGLVALAILGIRDTGFLQPLELTAFDKLMRNRPIEKPDDRFLVIEITGKDLSYQKEMGMERQGSLADEALSQILEKLKPLQPRAIGLDIYRDFPVKHQPNLVPQLQDTSNFLVICKGGDPTDDTDSGITPPPEVSGDRVGFSDVVIDEDGILRRHLWYATFNINSGCQTEQSLSLLLALHYLDAEGISPEITREYNLRLGQTTLKRLKQPANGYRNFDDLGYQMLLNYRHTGKKPIAQSMTLREFLKNPIKPSDVKDKIVLIGVTDKSWKDYFATPYSRNQLQDEQMAGVFIQLQMTSQIISAALAERPLLDIWPQWGEILWIFAWSLTGGLLAWRQKSSWIFITAEGITIGILYGICLFLLIQGIWVPLVPSAIAIVIAGGTAIAIPQLLAESELTDND